MSRVLVPDYMGGQVVAGIRSLARKSDCIDLAWGYPKTMPIVRSRWIRKLYRITSLDADPDRFLKDVLGLLDGGGYTSMIPFGLQSYHVLVKHRKRVLDKVPCLLPDEKMFAIASDKRETLRFCRSIGIDGPEEYSIDSESDLGAVSRAVRYPVVIKARSGSGVGVGLRYANDVRELERYYREISGTAAKTGFEFSRPLVQEFVPGFIHDACAVTMGGRVAQVLTQVRRVMYPIYGGVGAVNVTTDEPELAAAARRLLESLEWNGPTQIEFKKDSRDGKYKIIEINPKLWGTLDLSIKSGIDFPGIIRDYLERGTIPEARSYPAGIRYIFRYPQALYALRQIRKRFGRAAARDGGAYTATFTDVDFSDFPVDAARALKAYAGILLGKVVESNANLPDELIPRE